MSKTMFSEVDPAQRAQLMIDNCDEHEKTSYMKDLTQDDVDVKNETISSNCIKVFRLEEELKVIKDGYKDRINPMKEETRELCKQVENRKEQVNGMLFHFADHENSIMNTYDEMGEFVSSRRLKPEEKQARLFIAHNKASGE